MNGKGWRQRPIQNRQVYSDSWDRIFRKKDKEVKDGDRQKQKRRS